jgi:hypothetical protein
MQLNLKDSTTDHLEYNIKISRPTEKMLEKQKRNKRKSKIFLQRKQTNSDEELNIGTKYESRNFLCEKNEEDIEGKCSTEQNSRKGNLFNFNEEDYHYSPKNHNYTLELFQSLSMEDSLTENTSIGKENIYPCMNSVSEILTELSSETINKTSSSSSFITVSESPFFNNTSKNKRLFSEKFKSTHGKDSYPSKRFKI